ncbi:BA14K family protein [Mesorhizobium sp. M0136]
MQYCFSRYRSYRPADNTYQPYSGGPRSQCE